MEEVKAPRVVSRKERLIYVGLSVFAIAWAIAEWMWNPPESEIGVGVAVLHVLFLALVPIFPEIGCWLVIILMSIWSLTPLVTSGPSQIWGCMVALGVLAYRTNRIALWAGYGLCIGCQGVEIAFLHFSGTQWRGLAAFVAMMLLPVFAGTMLRHQRELVDIRERVERLDAEKRLRKHDDQVALAIHDSLTGELSLAIREAQRRLRALPDEDGGDDEDRMSWMRVEGYLHNALDGVRQVVLNLNDGGVSDGFDRDWGTRIEQAMNRGHDELGKAGYSGTVEYVHRDGAIGAPEGRECISLIQELYANIVRHGLRGKDSYRISVHIDRDGVSVQATNLVAVSDADSIESGSGLRMHADIIRKLGGEVLWRATGPQWSIEAFIPCHD